MTDWQGGDRCRCGMQIWYQRLSRPQYFLFVCMEIGDWAHRTPLLLMIIHFVISLQCHWFELIRATERLTSPHFWQVLDELLSRYRRVEFVISCDWCVSVSTSTGRRWWRKSSRWSRAKNWRLLIGSRFHVRIFVWSPTLLVVHEEGRVTFFNCS